MAELLTANQAREITQKSAAFIFKIKETIDNQIKQAASLGSEKTIHYLHHDISEEAVTKIIDDFILSGYTVTREGFKLHITW